jgi:hypothetical protein
MDYEKCHDGMHKNKKSKLNLATVTWTLLALATVWSLLGLTESLSELLMLPLRSLSRSGRALDAQVLEVSENVDSVKKATRQLMQPWGAVRLSRRLTTSSTPDAPPPATLASPSPAEP